MMEDKWPQRGDLYWYVNWPYGTASSIQVLTAVYDGFGVDKTVSRSVTVIVQNWRRNRPCLGYWRY